MKAIPTPEHFEAFERAIDQFRAALIGKSLEVTKGISNDPGFRLTEQMVVEVAESFKAARSEAIQACFNEETDVAYSWLDSEPSFQMALQKLGFTVSGTDNPYEKVIEECQQIHRKWLAHRVREKILRHATLHLTYMGGVARASSGFITGERRRAALEGPKAIQKMLDLMNEIEKIRETTDFLGRPVSIGGQFWERTKSNMEETLEHLFSTTRRDDKDLATRLMASELIRLHIKLFFAPHKNAVFRLMDLPFIDRPIEMKTIERLVTLENARSEKLGSSKLSFSGREIIC